MSALGRVSPDHPRAGTIGERDALALLEPGGRQASCDSAVLQELTFWYGPVGNITRINNTGDTGGTLYFANIAVTANRTFTYDALYRLVAATGREKTSLGHMQGGEEPAYGNLPELNTAVQAYTQSYSYDTVGNIAEMAHVVAGSAGTYDWTRAYAYAGDSNRLNATDITTASGTVTEAFAHDERGSIVYLPGLKFSPSSTLDPNIETDFRDQVVKVPLATSGHYAAYWQDGGGQRVRQLVVKGGTIEERRYVGPYEVWTSNTTTSGDPSERTTLHVMDGTGRIALRETLTKRGGSAVTPEVTVRYQLGDQLGTACVELDGSGNLLSYEESHPYGTTAWQAPELTTVSLKRYKYTGMERDEETGLQRHGVRYYATWLGRWTSADPIGLGDGRNRFCYCHCGPLRGSDHTGMRDDSVTTSVLPAEARRDDCEDIADTSSPSGASEKSDVPIVAGAAGAPGKTVTRWTRPSVDPNPTEAGLKARDPQSTLRPAEHVLNEHLNGPTPYKSASDRLLGSETITAAEAGGSSRLWIDLSKLIVIRKSGQFHQEL